jgi:hypothetical protein
MTTETPSEIVVAKASQLLCKGFDRATLKV